MKKYFVVWSIILIALLSGAAISFRHYNQKDWESKNREVLLNTLMETLKNQVKEDALYLVDFPIILNDQELKAVRVELTALPNKTLKKIGGKCPVVSDNVGEWKFLNKGNPLVSAIFCVSKSTNNQRAYVVWTRELEIPLFNSTLFLITWKHYGAYKKEEGFSKALLGLGATNEKTSKLWKEISKREDNGWL